MTTTLKPALRALPPECTVSSGIIEPSTQGGSMARRRYQCGSVILKGQVWYGKYRDDVVEQDGTVTRVQRRTPLGTKKEYPTKRLAERKLEQILCRINAVEYLSWEGGNVGRVCGTLEGRDPDERERVQSGCR